MADTDQTDRMASALSFFNANDSTFITAIGQVAREA